MSRKLVSIPHRPHTGMECPHCSEIINLIASLHYLPDIPDGYLCKHEEHDYYRDVYGDTHCVNCDFYVPITADVS